MNIVFPQLIKSIDPNYETEQTLLSFMPND